MKGNTLKKAALCVALGACLGALAPMAFAQSVTGAVAGRADAGAVITVTNKNTGLSRSVTAGADGSYRLGQLPTGDYELQVSREGRPVRPPT